MKIKKTYQGAIPLNRISNNTDNSDVNTYSARYINEEIGKLEESDGRLRAAIEDLGSRAYGVELNGEPVYVDRLEIGIDGSYSRGYYVQGFVGTTVPDGEAIVQLENSALVRNMYGVVYYSKDGTFIPLNYSNPAVPVYTYFNLKTKQVHVYTPAVFGNCEFVLYVEYVRHE